MKKKILLIGTSTLLLVSQLGCNSGGGGNAAGSRANSNGTLFTLSSGGVAGSGSTAGAGSSVDDPDFNLTPVGTRPEAEEDEDPVRDGDPVLEIPVNGVGYNPAQGPDGEITVQVKDILKVQFVPGLPEEEVGEYSKLMVFIKVGSKQVQTDLLSNGYHDGEPDKSPIYNFSGGFTKDCASSDTECRQTVVIKVYKPNYDHCAKRWFGTICDRMQFIDGSSLFGGFAYYNVMDDHKWNGTLYIETDDTTEIAE